MISIFEASKRIKINDFFEFPTEINMEPFTLDYLTKESDQLDEINMDTSNKSQREYELVGVLVHMAPQIQDITIPSSKNASQHLAIRQQKDDSISSMILMWNCLMRRTFLNSVMADQNRLPNGIPIYRRVLLEHFQDRIARICYFMKDAPTHQTIARLR